MELIPATVGKSRVAVEFLYVIQKYWLVGFIKGPIFDVMEPDKPVLFFDGVCGLCNRAVDFVIRSDKKGQIYVSPLQGETAKRLLEEELRESLDTLVLYYNTKNLIKSRALFEILRLTRSGWRWLRIFRFLPDGFLDLIYDVVANNRYRIFGKKDACRLPTPEERSRFLD